MSSEGFIYEFADNTTLHGAPKIIRSRSLCTRFFWTFVFVSASTMFGFQLAQLLSKYFAYDTHFKVEIRKDAAVFPLVTLCKTQSLDLLTMKKLYELFARHNETDRADLAKAMNNSFVHSFSVFYDKVVAKIDRLAHEHITAELFDWSPKMLFSFDKATLEQGATRFDDFIVNSETIGKNHFSMEILFDGIAPSQCFTYQHSLRNLSQQHKANARSRVNWDAEIMFGHGMLPTVEDILRIPTSVDKLVGILADRQSIEIHLHPTGSKPSLLLPERDINVLPGYVTAFSITVSSTERLGQPYGECRRSYSFENQSTVPYVQAICYDACIQNEIITSCSCKDASLTNFDSISQINNVPYCNSFSDLVRKIDVTDDELMIALNRFIWRTGCAKSITMNKTISAACDFSCPRACSEVHIDIDVNMIKFSGRNRYINMTADKMMNNLLERGDNERLELFKNYFEFKINDSESAESRFNDFNYEKLSGEMSSVFFQLKNQDLSVILEVPDYTIYQLLSDIGGQLGLWIGMSVITLMEVFELIVNAIKLFFRKCTSLNRNDKVLENEHAMSRELNVSRKNKGKYHHGNHPKISLKYRGPIAKQTPTPTLQRATFRTNFIYEFESDLLDNGRISSV